MVSLKVSKIMRVVHESFLFIIYQGNKRNHSLLTHLSGSRILFFTQEQENSVWEEKCSILFYKSVDASTDFVVQIDDKDEDDDKGDWRMSLTRYRYAPRLVCADLKDFRGSHPFIWNWKNESHTTNKKFKNRKQTHTYTKKQQLKTGAVTNHTQSDIGWLCSPQQRRREQCRYIPLIFWFSSIHFLVEISILWPHPQRRDKIESNRTSITRFVDEICKQSIRSGSISNPKDTEFGK